MSLFASNPRTIVLKKTMFELLQERYSKYDSLLERVSQHMIDADVKDFVKLISDVYEISYTKAVNDHREGLAKIGLTARIVSPID